MQKFRHFFFGGGGGGWEGLMTFKLLFGLIKFLYLNNPSLGKTHNQFCSI